MRTAAVLVALSCALVRPAAADFLDDLPSERTIMLLLASEYVIPDIRLQLREDEKLVLSWPVHLVDLAPWRSSALTLFGEPQYQPSTSDLRLVAGARLFLAPAAIGAVLEGGAVVGHDAGTGGMVGLGVIVWPGKPAQALAIVGRATFLPEGERRYDVSIDVTFMALATFIRLAAQ